MTYDEFQTQLNTLSIPNAYSVFEEAQSGDYICWITDSIDTLHADDMPLLIKNTIQVELYTAQKNTERETEIENLFITLALDYIKDPDIWIEDEEMFVTYYHVQV